MLIASRKNKNNSAFTIVELLIVVVVIAILAAIVTVAYNGVRQQAIASVLKVDLTTAAKQLEIGKIGNSELYAADDSGLKPSDGTTFLYASTGATYCLSATSVSTAASYYISSETSIIQDGVCPLDIPSDQVAKLVASDAASGDFYGYKVAVWNDTVVIGSWDDDDSGTNSGSAYVYTLDGSTWTQQAKLHASDAGGYDFFGMDVAISGETIVIAAPGDNGNSGSVYAFTRSGSTWTQQAKINASDAANNSYDWFGQGMSLLGDTLVVGARGDNSDTGSAYVFTRTGSVWTQQTKLTASDAATGDFFGSTVSFSAETVVVGAYGNDDSGSQSGSAYVYTRSGSAWTQQAKLVASNASSNGWFGISASLSGNTVLIGASRSDGNSGSVYVFTRSGSTWTQQTQLTPSDVLSNGWFGMALSLSGNVAVIGAYGDNSNTGSAYVFTGSGSTWTQQAKLVASDSATGRMFGSSVSSSGSTAIIGSYTDNHAGANAGSAYIFN